MNNCKHLNKFKGVNNWLTIVCENTNLPLEDAATSGVECAAAKIIHDKVLYEVLYLLGGHVCELIEDATKHCAGGLCNYA